MSQASNETEIRNSVDTLAKENEAWLKFSDFSSVVLLNSSGERKQVSVHTGQEHLKYLWQNIQKVQRGGNIVYVETTFEGCQELTSKMFTEKFRHQHCEGLLISYDNEGEPKYIPEYFGPVKWFLDNCPCATPIREVDNPRKFVRDGVLFWNEFSGFPYQTDKITDEQIQNGKYILSWIKRIICKNNQDLYHFIVDFMAQKRQHPFEKIEKTLALYGEQGTGKNTFFTKIFGALFPAENFVYMNRVEQLTGDFNGELENAILVFLDEAVWGGNKREGDFLKGLHNPTIRINKKGKEAYLGKSHFDILIASNKDWVAPVEPGDRRYLVTQISSEERNDIDKSSRLFESINRGGLFYLDRILRDRVVETNFRDNNCIPVTSEKAALLVESLDRFRRFVIETFYYGVNSEYVKWSNPDEIKRGEPYKIQASKLYEAYKSWDGSSRSALTMTMFGKRIKSEFPKTFKCKYTSRARIYIIDYVETVIEDLVAFTSLDLEDLKRILDIGLPEDDLKTKSGAS